MNKVLLIAAAASVALGSSAFAATTHHKMAGHKEMTAEQPKERLGTLTCDVAGGVGMVIGSNKAVDCTFRQSTGKIERYTGSIGKLGLDIGVTKKSKMVWTVVNTEATRVGSGALAGTYVGASASGSVGRGLGANALVGGNGKNFGLQPLSGETSTGINVAAGVSRLHLEKAG